MVIPGSCGDGPGVQGAKAKSRVRYDVRSCVRPVRAAHAAGPDGFRNPAPNKVRGVGTPVIRAGCSGASDRPIIIASRHAGTPGSAERSGGGRERSSPIGLAGRHHGPRDAGHLVGQTCPWLEQGAAAASLRGRRSSKDKSPAEARPGLAYRMIAVAPSTSNGRRRSSPARLMPPIRRLPPLECSRGVSPRRPGGGRIGIASGRSVGPAATRRSGRCRESRPAAG
jgi:hypothetical protein